MADNSQEAATVAHVLGFVVDERARHEHPALYRNLVLSMATDLIGQPQALRDAILSTIASARFSEPGVRIGNDATTWAQIDFFAGALRLQFDGSIDRAFVLLVVLAHEFMHLRHDFEYVYAEPGVIRLSHRHIGPSFTYLSERRALGREYDLLRASFSAEDARRLEITMRRAYGRIANDHRTSLVDHARLRANRTVASDARLVHAISRQDYIAAELRKNYRERHAETQAIRFLSEFDRPPPTCPDEIDARIALFTRVHVEIQCARAAGRSPP